MITINPNKLVRNVSTNGEFIYRGGLALQAELGVQNVKRFGRFLTTPQGGKFLAQQILLQGQNPKEETRIYNPAAPLLAKGLSQEFTSQKPTRHIDLSGFNEAPTPEEQVNGENPNAITFFAPDKNGNKQQKVNLQVRYGGKLGDERYFPDAKGNLNLGAEVKDFIKFRIRDAVNGMYIIFPALLSGAISDNSSTTPTETSYIGRADKVYVYGSHTRTISFTVNIVALTTEDIPIIWQKINAAKGLVLPEYKTFTELGGAQRPVAPVCYLTLGDLFIDTPGLFTSVNLSIPENSTWELSDGNQVPHLCSLAFEFTYIGKNVQTMSGTHFDGIDFPTPPTDENSSNNEDTNSTDPPVDQRTRQQQRQDRRTTFRQNKGRLGTPERRQARKARRQQRRQDRQARISRRG